MAGLICGFRTTTFATPAGVVIAALLSVATFVGCDGAGATTAASGPKTQGSGPSGPAVVEVFLVRPQKVDLPGASVRGMETALLMAKVGGYVKEIKRIDGEEVDIGMTVKQNDVLAVIDIPEMEDELNEKIALFNQANSGVAQAIAVIGQANAEIKQRGEEVKQAEAQLAEKEALKRLNEIKYRRMVGLVESGAVGKENLDEAKFALVAAEAILASVNADVATAEARQDSAKSNLEKANADKDAARAYVEVAKAAVSRLRTLAKYAEIKAPFNGVVIERKIDRGAFVQPANSNSAASPLFKVTRINKVRVIGSVPSSKAGKIALGQQAVFSAIGGLPGVEITGSVTRSSQALDPESRMMRIEVHFDNPIIDEKTGKQVAVLKPGMFGSLSVSLWDENNRTLVVPVSAVGKNANGEEYVMLVDGNRCRQKMIIVEFNDGEMVGIQRGVKLGDTIILTNVSALKDGQEISLKSQ